MTKHEGKKGWEDLLFSTIEKVAGAPQMLKDPQGAIDWVKGLREDLGEKIKEEISSRISKLDLQVLGKKVGDHLAENYRLKIEAKIEWEPKKPKNETEA
jgi:hypothetical protein